MINLCAVFISLRCFFFSSRRRHTRCGRDWSSDVCSSDLGVARLKRVAGTQTLTLTHYGRRSWKPYDVTVWFAVDGDKILIGTANVNRQWVRNVQKTPRVRLSIADERLQRSGRFITDPT